MANTFQSSRKPGQNVLPLLPYRYDALEPVIDAESLRIHHDILHKGYVDNLNKTELALEKARKTNSFETIKQLAANLAYNASGHTLHSIYWTNMAPPGGTHTPLPQTAEKIEHYFGSVDSFKAQFIATANIIEGGGWCVAMWNPYARHMEIGPCEKHQNLVIWGGVPLLVCDVWEHAYYLNHKADRQGFINQWWSLINWYDVERRLVTAIGNHILLQ